MNIDVFEIYRYSLEFKEPLQLKGQTLNSREGLIVRLCSANGAEGFGEIAPLPGFSRETLDQARAQIQVLKAKLSGAAIPANFRSLNGHITAWLDDPNLKPSVRFGLEAAILNLMASDKHMTLHKLIGKTTHAKVRINGLLSGTIEQLAHHAQSLIEAGFKELKLKVSADVDEAIKQVQSINEIVYGKALLHLDVNQAWSYDEAVSFGKAIGCDAVSYIEEPFKDAKRIPEFFNETLIPVALDESLQRLTLEEIRSIPGVYTLILKPTLLGGIERTWQLIQQGEDCALDAVISSSFESSLGIWTLANLAGTVAHGSISAGLDTLKWFESDLLNIPIDIQRGAMDISHRAIRSQDINFRSLQSIE